ncbi:MAG: alpha/beta fold hydrolase [Promethearchaeota archaeon]|nr:MAG: alpha/beta fold hydrolase [Candidatus Lokiarchaeota archaeon]
MNEVNVQDIDILVEEDNINLKASLYYSNKTKAHAPFIVNLAGLLDHRESYFVQFFSKKFAQEGFYVLSYDYRAHGETKKQTGSRWDKMVVKIFSDIQVVIDWILKNQSDRLLDNQIFLFGRSMGGAIILTNGFKDHRIRKLVALCTRYDYHTTMIKFPEDIIKEISPRYFLKKKPENDKRILIAHCKDDPRIPFENLGQIKEALGLSNENVLIYENGGHSFKGHREDVFERTIRFLKEI